MVQLRPALQGGTDALVVRVPSQRLVGHAGIGQHLTGLIGDQHAAGVGDRGSNIASSACRLIETPRTATTWPSAAPGARTGTLRAKPGVWAGSLLTYPAERYGAPA